MNKKRNAIIIFLITIMTTFLESSAGKTGWLIFRKIQSPKPKPLTTVAAIRGDISGVLYNPSILATIQQKEIFTIGEIGIIGDNLLGLIYGHPFGKSGIASGILNYNLGKEKIYWIEAGEEKSDEITLQNDYLGFISYGRYLSDNISLGVTAKFATTKLVEAINSSAYCIDIGGSYFYKNFGISLVIQNIGKSEKFIEKEEKLPSSIYITLGYSGRINVYNYIFGFDIPYIIDERRVIPGVGIEIGREPLSIFFGYRINVSESVFNIGLTLTLKNFDIGYTYIPNIWLNPSHRVSLGFKF
ncbi:MAG: hypothetical protein N2Z73_03630 [Endomicrobia bacterium]|nr:hypothetical protein [Endomicrobiia bacterium]